MKKFKTLSEPMKIAFISATAIIMAAIIGGIFQLISTHGGGGSPQPTPTAITSIPATFPASVTSTVNPTPTLIVTTNTNPYGGRLVLDDPLQDNSKGFQWDEPSDGSCRFVPGKHYLLTGSANQYIPCHTEAPQSNVGNFVYQITMTILSGLTNTGSRESPVGAGPQFRIESSQNNPHYGILFNALGNWSFYVVNGGPIILLGGARCGEPCPYFKTGYNQPNVFTIKALGSQLDVWLNGYLIEFISDATITSGFLGVRLNVGSSSSSVEFSDLKLWQL